MDQLQSEVEDRLISISGFPIAAAGVTLPDAQLFIARLYGFQSWAKLLDSISRKPGEQAE